MTLEASADLYGNAFLRSDAPDHRLPRPGCLPPTPCG